MSLVSWYIILTKLWDQRRLKQSARARREQFWSAPSVKDGVERLKKGDNFRAIAEDGLRAVSHHEGRLTDRIDMHEWVTMSLQRSVDQVNSNMSEGPRLPRHRRLAAPFVGLFGTVWGVMNALIAIGLAGQASIDKVAGPVGGALIMTALGLFVAVPAVLGLQLAARPQQGPAGCGAQFRERPARVPGQRRARRRARRWLARVRPAAPAAAVRK